MDYPKFSSIEIEVSNKICIITLSRHTSMNAIDFYMPSQIREAVYLANQDNKVNVILIQGKNNTFCSGYDLKEFAQQPRGVMGSQEMPWDPYLDYKFMKQCTEDFMSIFNSLKPTICKIQGYAVAGGSDIALCCDIIFMEENAKIGYPPARLWGCPTSAMWTFRIGQQQAKRMLFTGELINGIEAEKIGLVYKCCKQGQIHNDVQQFIDKIINVPQNQLWMQKQVINSVVENMGLHQTQRLATLFDGMSRHTPEGVQFKKLAQEKGFKEAVSQRDKDLYKSKL